jgi:hypothetical protein
MAGSDRLAKAAGGCEKMAISLQASMEAARIAVSDEDFPTAARWDIKQAVRAVEHAQKRLQAVSEIIAKERAYNGVKRGEGQ